MADTIQCSRCQARLSLSTELPPGSQFRCGQCGALVTVGGAVPPPVPREPRRDDHVTESLARASRRASHAREDREPADWVARRPRDKAGMSSLALATFSAVAVMLIGGLVVLVAMWWNTESAAPVVDANQPGPPQAPAAAVPANVQVPPVEPAGGLPLATLAALKRATVFIKVDAGNQLATGSGFLARLEGTTAFIVTNNHVIEPAAERFLPFRPPFGRPRLGNAGNQRLHYTVVVGSGTKEERSYTAELASADAKVDLAVLRIRDMQNIPNPVTLDNNLKLVETMPVFILGFPFGEALAFDRGNPAITVGKGSVSSIRLDNEGQVKMVQINGDLNPGNSGGPVVDAQGRLIGIAVATVKGTQIGLAVPAPKLTTLLAQAPVQGAVAAAPAQQQDPVPQAPAQPRVQPILPPPAVANQQPLSDQELARDLEAVATGQPALVNNALNRLSKAKPEDKKRDRVLKAVEPLATKEEFAVGMYALKVLAVWGSKDNTPVAVRALDCNNSLIRMEAIRTLGKFKDDRAAEPLAKRLAVFQDRMLASQALQQLGSAAEKFVQPFVRDQDLFARAEACKILGVIGTRASVDMLTEASQDTNGLVRQAARQALAAVQARMP